MGKLRIDVLGTAFTIQANEDNEYLEKLLGYYNRIIKDVQAIDSVKTPLQVAILSGIMLCDELYKEKQNKHYNIEQRCKIKNYFPFVFHFSPPVFGKPFGLSLFDFL